MYLVIYSRRFKKSFRKLRRSGKLSPAVRSDLAEIFELLARRKNLPLSYADHQLQGDHNTYRECHLRGDLLLMYRVDEEKEVVMLSDIGSHSQLFG